MAAINEQDVLSALKSCYDPEIPVNIVDLGLIYKVNFARRAGRNPDEPKQDVTVLHAYLSINIRGRSDSSAQTRRQSNWYRVRKTTSGRQTSGIELRRQIPNLHLPTEFESRGLRSVSSSRTPPTIHISSAYRAPYQMPGPRFSPATSINRPAGSSGLNPSGYRSLPPGHNMPDSSHKHRSGTSCSTRL